MIFLQYKILVNHMSIIMPTCCGEVSYAFTDHENNPLTQHLWRGEALHRNMNEFFLHYTILLNHMSILMPICCGEVSYAFIDH